MYSLSYILLHGLRDIPFEDMLPFHSPGKLQENGKQCTWLQCAGCDARGGDGRYSKWA